MATLSITTASTTPEWVLACNPFEECEIESINGNVSFRESELIPTAKTEENTMLITNRVPRDFAGDGTYSLWVLIDKYSKVVKRPPSKTTNIAGVEVDPLVKSIPTTDTFHHLGHEGYVFIHSTRHSAIASGANLDILIRIPAGDALRQVHARYFYIAMVNGNSVLDVDVTLYKDPITTADGTLDIINSTNDVIVKTTAVQIYTNPTVTDVGEFKTTGMIVGEKRSVGSREQSVPEWILAPNGNLARDYLFRATNNSVDTVDINDAIFFFDSGAT